MSDSLSFLLWFTGIVFLLGLIFGAALMWLMIPHLPRYALALAGEYWRGFAHGRVAERRENKWSPEDEQDLRDTLAGLQDQETL